MIFINMKSKITDKQIYLFNYVKDLKGKSVTVEKIFVDNVYPEKLTVRSIKNNLTRLIKMNIGIEEEFKCNNGVVYSCGYYYNK